MTRLSTQKFSNNLGTYSINMKKVENFNGGLKVDGYC